MNLISASTALQSANSRKKDLSDIALTVSNTSISGNVCCRQFPGTIKATYPINVGGNVRVAYIRLETEYFYFFRNIRSFIRFCFAVRSLYSTRLEKDGCQAYCQQKKYFSVVLN